MRPKAILILLLFSVVGSSQTRVDNLVEELNRLSEASFDTWKMMPVVKSEAEAEMFGRQDYDDSHWETLVIGQSVSLDACWLRKVVTLPALIAGHPVEGLIKILVSVDDLGDLWIDGKSMGRFYWDGEFILTDNARAGMNLTLLIRAINTGGPLRLLGARAVSETALETQSRIEDFVLSLQVGQKLLSFDTYQTNSRVKIDPGTDLSRFRSAEKKRLNDILQGITKEVDTQALKTGDMNRFWQSIDRVRARLKPVSNFAKRFTLFFDSNAHIDTAWLWREKETKEVCYRTFSSVMNMFRARPDFTYTQSQAALYRWMEESYPDLFAEIQQWVKNSRWELVGGMWVEPDCNLPSGESWVRQLLAGQTYLQDRFGKRVKIGWNPDSFGYNWNMPQCFLNAGIDAFITQKIGWNDTNVFPYRAFWWESPDGSRILAYFPFNYVDSIEDPFHLADWLRQYEANTGFTKLMVLFGVGDHGGGPSLEMLDRIDRLADLDIFPSIEFGTAENYLNWLKTQDLSRLPVWEDELYLEYHRGTFTTQSQTKKWNRNLEILLTDAERIAALAGLHGSVHPQTFLDDAWKKVLFNQFHDILPGSSIRPVYMDADKSYREAAEIGDHELQRGLQALADCIHTASLPEGNPVVVFNTLSWERTDLVRVRLSGGDAGDYIVLDADGDEIPCQTVRSGPYDRELLFVAQSVPSMGYKTYLLRPGKTNIGTGPTIFQETLENEFFRITVHPDSGWVESILDKIEGREILTGFGNRLQVLEDKPRAWDAWNIGLTGVEYPTRYRKAEIVEQGPVRVVLRLHRDYLQPGVRKSFPTEDFPSSFFTQDIILTRSIPRIDFVTKVEWWEDKTMLKVAFPVSVADTLATYEIPFGSIRRSTTLKRPLDRGKWEVPALKWADLSQSDYGVSLINKDKYGHDIKGSTMRLSLLRSPQWPDPTADRGDHLIAYSLYPHAGSWTEKTVHQAWQYNTPLHCWIADRHAGPWPATQALIHLAPAHMILTALKQAEGRPNAWIIRWYDSIGEADEVVLRLPIRVKAAYISNFLEERLKPVSVGEEIRVPSKKNGVTSLLVEF